LNFFGIVIAIDFERTPTAILDCDCAADTDSDPD
jgi:hypothetical protein